MMNGERVRVDWGATVIESRIVVLLGAGLIISLGRGRRKGELVLSMREVVCGERPQRGGRQEGRCQGRRRGV